MIVSLSVALAAPSPAPPAPPEWHGLLWVAACHAGRIEVVGSWGPDSGWDPDFADREAWDDLEGQLEAAPWFPVPGEPLDTSLLEARTHRVFLGRCETGGELLTTYPLTPVPPPEARDGLQFRADVAGYRLFGLVGLDLVDL